MWNSPKCGSQVWSHQRRNGTLLQGYRKVLKALVSSSWISLLANETPFPAGQKEDQKKHLIPTLWERPQIWLSQETDFTISTVRSNKDLTLTSVFDQTGTKCLSFPDIEIHSTHFSLKLPLFWSVIGSIINHPMSSHLDTPQVNPIQTFAAA